MNAPHEEATTLARGADALGVALDPAAVAALMTYLDLLERWNRRFNLTAIRERPRMVVEHLLDSLSVHPHVHGLRVADVGTGAGLPGIPLALAGPGRAFVLLDANGKKTRFVREVVRVLGLANVEVVHSRSEDYRPGAGFDTVVCRAFAPLPRMLADAGHLCARGGLILAQKGRFPEAEIAAVPPGWSLASAELTVPGLPKARHLLTLRRQHAP